jgi:hypothetical protein
LVNPIVDGIEELVHVIHTQFPEQQPNCICAYILLPTSTDQERLGLVDHIDKEITLTTSDVAET